MYELVLIFTKHDVHETHKDWGNIRQSKGDNNEFIMSIPCPKRFLMGAFFFDSDLMIHNLKSIFEITLDPFS